MRPHLKIEVGSRGMLRATAAKIADKEIPDGGDLLNAQGKDVKRNARQH